MSFNPDALRVVMGRRRIRAPELATKLGCRSSVIGRYLRGIDEPDDVMLAHIAAALAWPVGFFTRDSVEWPP